MIQIHRKDDFPAGLASPDVYFTPGYGGAARLINGGEWVLLEAFDGDWQMPLIVRTLADGMLDAISPYGYSGIYASASLSSAQVAEAWSQTVSYLRDLGIISVLLRHSPLVAQPSGLAGLIPVISHHPTIVLEPADSETAWSSLVGACRTTIRKALKNGYTGDVRQASSQDITHGGPFRRLYEGTMARRDAAPLYFFDDDYYRELVDGLGADLLLVEVRDTKGVPVSSSLLMCHEHLLHYHLSGSSVEDARMGTNNLMLWVATQFAAEQGTRQFHLGGGMSERDDLFRFKRAFGGRELEYGVSGLIIDPKVYQTHTERRAKECDTTTDALSEANFFPAYRGGGG